MGYIIGIAAVAIIIWLYSSKKQSDTVRSFASIDLAKDWFKENNLDFENAKFSTIPDQTSTTIVGITRNKAGDQQGFAITIDHQYGTKPDGILITPAKAANAKSLIPLAKQAGVPLIDYLRMT